jgi:hypothetical protein
MKKLLFLASLLLLSAGAVKAQRTTKTYQPVYLINTESATRIAVEQQLKKKTFSIEMFLIDYPVLDSIKDYNPKAKYSLINDALIRAVAPSANGKWTYYYLKNDQIYKVKKKKTINRSF